MRAPNFTASHPVFAIVANVIRFVAKLREVGERRRVVYSLATLDDHMLRDIGLTRSDVDAALVEPVMTDGTLVLAERAHELRQHQRAMAQEAQAWAGMMPETDGRNVSPFVKRVA